MERMVCTEVNLDGHDQHFYGKGKLLLTGEYFVLDGAKALALPVSVGQSLSVEYQASYSPVLNWKSYDVNGVLWLEANFEFWHFNSTDENPSEAVVLLQKILQQARKLNPHFLRDNVGVNVVTKLGFPLEWGLGSSSTLIYNIAQWAYVSPFELLFNTYGGSGYDIACAQSDGPIIYERKKSGPYWSLISFDPSFQDNLYFVYLGKKQNSRDGIEHYSKKRPYKGELLTTLSNITRQMLTAESLDEFDLLISAHEELIAENLGLDRAKNLYFADYWGEIKSLGAWGGDFVLVTSNRSAKETQSYFNNFGLDVFIPYKDMISGQNKNMINKNEKILH